MGVELESSRRKVRDLEQKLRRQKRAKQRSPEAAAAKRKVAVLVAVALLVAGGTAAVVYLTMPAPPIKVVAPRITQPAKPARKLIPKVGTVAHVYYLEQVARTHAQRAMTHIAAAVLRARAGEAPAAKESLARAAQLVEKDRRGGTMLRAEGLVACLRQKISGEEPDPKGRYADLTEQLDKQLSYKVSADVWTWIGRTCFDLGGGAASAETLPHALDAAAKVKSFQRLRTLMAVTAAYEDRRDLTGVDRAAARILDRATGLIATDMIKARALLAETYWRLGNKERAMELIRVAARRERGTYYSAPAMAHVTRALAVMGQKEQTEAWLKETREAVKSDASWGRRQSLPHLGAAYMLLDRYGEGWALLDNVPTAADVMLEVGLLEQATRYKRVAPEIRHRLAVAFARAGKQAWALRAATDLRLVETRALTLTAILLNSRAEANAPDASL